ncbi:MAG: LytTR family DNA-binding domain-containing protein [Bacteroidota bacterium]|nr:LytTR family DNA-binding domain-containing protein [Bacteroidota bacterium]
MYRQIYYLGFKPDTAENLKNLTAAMYGNKYTSVPIAYVPDLKKIDAKVENTIIIYIEELNLEQRRFIWQFRINYPIIQMIFCSKDLMVANFSWQCNAVFFLPYPFSRRAVALMYQKIEEKYTAARLKVKLNYQGGFDIVTSDDICFCEGDGNYTTVHLRNSKSVLLSKKIKDIFQRLSPFPEIVRIGKSYIVNVENITRVDDMKVHFKGLNNNSTSIVLSPVYLKRLKEHLLWFTA